VKSRAHPGDLATSASPPEQTQDSCATGETQEFRALSVQEIELRLKGEAQALPFAEGEERYDPTEIATPELDHAVYDEYVRDLNDVPTLHDAVALPPRRAPQPDFRRGQRPDQRKERRLDAREQRDANLAEIEHSYREYELPEPAKSVGAKTKARKAHKPRTPRKSGKRRKS
jgi:hypothetical protein